MKKYFIAIALLTLSAFAVAQEREEPPPLPAGAEKFQPTVWTQRIAVTNGVDTIIPVLRTELEAHWQTSGGVVGMDGVKSVKYRTLLARPQTWVGNIAVWNGSNYQNNRGILRSYPDGSRFDDVLYYQGKVFEHRVRIKRNGVWKSSIIYTDVTARPPGYKGLTKSCASCHDQAGSGGYAVGLVPGGDGVISDPLDWSVVR